MAEENSIFSQPKIINQFEEYENLFEFEPRECQQLGRGRFKAKIYQKEFDDLTFFAVYLRRAMYIRTGNPKDRINFYFPLHMGGRFYYQGDHYTKGMMLGVAPGVIGLAVTPPNYLAFCAEINYRAFERCCEFGDFTIIRDAVLSGYPVKIDINEFRKLIPSLCDRNNTNLMRDLHGSNGRIYYLLHQVSQLIDPVSVRRYYYSTPRLKRVCRIVDFMEYLGKNYRAKLSPDIIAKDLGVSKATLQRTTNDCFGRSVAELIKIYRLSKLRSFLQAQKHLNISIRQLGNMFGFTHMGNMANDYYKQFGNLPSQERIFARSTHIQKPPSLSKVA